MWDDCCVPVFTDSSERKEHEHSVFCEGGDIDLNIMLEILQLLIQHCLNIKLQNA